jgi:hypothetical protein
MINLTVQGIVVAIIAFGTIIYLKKFLLQKAYDRRRNTWFPPEDLAERSITEYKKQKKTMELTQLRNIQHIEKLWKMNL